MPPLVVPNHTFFRIAGKRRDHISLSINVLCNLRRIRFAKRILFPIYLTLHHFTFVGVADCSTRTFHGYPPSFTLVHMLPFRPSANVSIATSRIKLALLVVPAQ